MIKDAGSKQFFLYWADGINPDTANWHLITVTDVMPRDVGQVESEEARFGTANADYDAVSLETQNRQNGGWGLWTNLQCDQSQNSILDWKAVKVSNYHWRNQQVPTGLC